MNPPENQDESEGCLVIVDDVPENLTLLNRTLSKHGYKIRAAATGAWAWKPSAPNPPIWCFSTSCCPTLMAMRSAVA